MQPLAAAVKLMGAPEAKVDPFAGVLMLTVGGVLTDPLCKNLLRRKLSTLARSLAPASKYVLAATNTQDVLTLNLEENIRGDLLNRIVAPPDMNKAATNR